MKESIFTTTTSTCTQGKYKEWEINELITHVRNTKFEADAVINIRIFLKSYKKSIGTLELIKLFLNK